MDSPGRKLRIHWIDKIEYCGLKDDVFEDDLLSKAMLFHTNLMHIKIQSLSK